MREHDPARELQVAQHPFRSDLEPTQHLGHLLRHVIDGGARVGKDDPFRGRVTDIAFVPQRGVLKRSYKMASHDAGEAANSLGEHRVALVGHCRAALLLLAKGLERLADLAPLEVADLSRDPFQGPGHRSEG